MHHHWSRFKKKKKKSLFPPPPSAPFSKHRYPSPFWQWPLGGKEKLNTHACTWPNPTPQLRYPLPGFSKLSNIYPFASFPTNLHFSSLHSFQHVIFLHPAPTTFSALSLFAVLTLLELAQSRSLLSICIPRHSSCAFTFSSQPPSFLLLSQIAATFPWICFSSFLQRRMKDSNHLG